MRLHEESTCTETLRENEYYIMDIIITTNDGTIFGIVRA